MRITTLKGYAGKECNNFKGTVHLKKENSVLIYSPLYSVTCQHICA